MGGGATVRALTSAPVLELTTDVHLGMLAHTVRGLPDEACVLFAGDPDTGEVTVFYPCRNAAESAVLYTVDPKDHLRADRDAEDRGLEIIGVMHSHTHTDAYPSPTDVDAAFDPNWHYLIVSLRQTDPVVRSYFIVDGEIQEEAVTVVGR